MTTWLKAAPQRFFILIGGLLLLVAAFLFALARQDDRTFDTIGGLPVHILVIHATIVLIVLAAIGTVILALRPGIRHTYGVLLLIVQGFAALTTWVAVESGLVLTDYPGLGSTEHAEAGKLLLWMMLPFLLATFTMVIADRHYHTEVNKHGTSYRNIDRQPPWLTATCVAAVVMALLVVGQTVIVGHSGAKGTWDGFDHQHHGKR